MKNVQFTELLRFNPFPTNKFINLREFNSFEYISKARGGNDKFEIKNAEEMILAETKYSIELEYIGDIPHDSENHEMCVYTVVMDNVIQDLQHIYAVNLV